jgi:hypothetical protein
MTEVTSEILESENPISDGHFIQIPVDFLRSKEYSRGAKDLYQLLATYCGAKEIAWPGQARLADELGVSDRTVRTWTRELVAKGLLEVKRRGLTKTNLYYLKRLPTSEKKILPFPSGSDFRHRPEAISDELHAFKQHALESHTGQEIVSDESDFEPDQRTAEKPKGDITPHPLLKQELEKAGIWPGTANQLVSVLQKNQRGTGYVANLVTWVQSQQHLANPGGYLAMMIRHDVTPPPLKTAYNRSNGKQIDFSKYSPGGKYAYLAAN